MYALTLATVQSTDHNSLLLLLVGRFKKVVFSECWTHTLLFVSRKLQKVSINEQRATNRTQVIQFVILAKVLAQKTSKLWQNYFALIFWTKPLVGQCSGPVWDLISMSARARLNGRGWYRDALHPVFKELYATIIKRK